MTANTVQASTTPASQDEDGIFSILTDGPLKRLLSYPQVKGKFYLSNSECREKHEEEFYLLATGAKDYVGLAFGDNVIL